MSLWTAKAVKAEEAENPRSKMQSGRMTVLLLEPVSFSGIAERKLTNLICTLKTAQPDGKHLVKKPVANVFKDTRAQKCESILQLVSGEKARQREIFDSYSI